MSAVDHALARLEPVSLAAANELAELQTRVDRKYIVDDDTLGALLADLGPTARVLEIDGDRACDYHSTYFDTDDLELYRATVQGRRERYKVRSRTYGESGPCFLEVKAKGRRGTNVKSRIAYCRHDNGVITPDGRDFVEHVTGRSDLPSCLAPVLTTQYDRSTVVDVVAHTRMTFDRRLRCSGHAGRRAAFGAIVLETKSTRAPSAVDAWLWRHQLRPRAISKFCTGLAAVRPDLSANKWHRVIDRHWRAS